MSLNDDNFEQYLEDRLAVTRRAIADWRARFEVSPFNALTQSDAIFRYVAEISVLERVLAMVKSANGLPRVRMIKEYAESSVLTAVLNPIRTNRTTHDMVIQSEAIVWAALLCDLRSRGVDE